MHTLLKSCAVKYSLLVNFTGVNTQTSSPVMIILHTKSDSFVILMVDYCVVDLSFSNASGLGKTFPWK